MKQKSGIPALLEIVFKNYIRVCALIGVIAISGCAILYAIHITGDTVTAGTVTISPGKHKAAVSK